MNYSQRQISCCSECIAVSSGCSFSQKQVICTAAWLAKANNGGYGGSDLDFKYFLLGFYISVPTFQLQLALK